MKKRLCVAVAVVGLAAAAGMVAAPTVSAASGDWRQYGFNAAHTSTNTAEQAITAATVSRLVPGWSVADTDLGVPTVAGGSVFVADHGVTAYAASDGQMLWRRMFTGLVAGQPAVIQGRLFACVDGRVLALGVDHGHTLFRAGRCSGAPVVDGSLGLTIADGVLYAWHVSGGGTAWRSPRSIDLADQLATLANGRVYVEGAYSAGMRDIADSHMYVLDERSGRLMSTRHATSGTRFIPGTSVVSGNLWTREFQPCLFCADIDGWVYTRALAVASGAIPQPRHLISDFYNESDRPIVGFGHLYTTDEELGFDWAYPVVPNATLWQSTLTASGDVTLAGRVAYFSDCGCALSTKDGSLLWASGGWTDTSPVIANGVVYWVQYVDGSTILRTFHLP